MGYISGYDTDDKHEGWIAMTYADGKVSSGTSNGTGHYLEGYTFLSETATRLPGAIDPAYLRPFAEVVGWLPRCECGWVGIEVPVPDDTDCKYREPTDAQEQLVMGQWRLHIRDHYPAAYSRLEVTA